TSEQLNQHPTANHQQQYRYSTFPQMEASSIHDQSGMSLEEEEEMRSMALFREELIAKKIKRRQRAAEAAGRKYPESWLYFT
ncbi:hypothetical protein MKW98_019899, partial [Papaver atlanticum]